MGVVPASMEWGVNEAGVPAPTYRLDYGTIGSSHALETADRVGVADDVMARARDIMGPADESLAPLLDDLALLSRDLRQRVTELDKHLEDAREASASAVRLRDEAIEADVQTAARWQAREARVDSRLNRAPGRMGAPATRIDTHTFRTHTHTHT